MSGSSEEIFTFDLMEDLQGRDEFLMDVGVLFLIGAILMEERGTVLLSSEVEKSSCLKGVSLLLSDILGG